MSGSPLGTAIIQFASGFRNDDDGSLAISECMEILIQFLNSFGISVKLESIIQSYGGGPLSTLPLSEVLHNLQSKTSTSSTTTTTTTLD